MSGFLLDTNVVSEYIRPVPHSAVTELWAARDDLWLSIIVVHELEYGIAILDEGRRRDGIRRAVSRILEEFQGRILPIEDRASETAVDLRAQARRNGRTLQLADALIAGTAVAHDLVLATRNVRDFSGLDIDIVNPWEAA